MTHINKINGRITNQNKEIEINLQGKNLLIVGGNGSGKTSFLKDIHKTIESSIIERRDINLKILKSQVKDLTLRLESPLEADAVEMLRSELDFAIAQLNTLTIPLEIDFNDLRKLSNLYDKGLATIRFFFAERSAAITPVSNVASSLLKASDLYNQPKPGINLEQHLVNLTVRAALSSTSQSNKITEIKTWIKDLNNNLKYLFEDDSTILTFDPDQLRYAISQDGKKPINFQNLSSGYLAILDIYADLLMHTEHLQITPAQLSGIALIDEIDAHLHVSLQRKIFPFLTKSFPNIQFIITTHSPFVLTSVDNAVIYDLTTNRECTDLSMYSVEAVLEGLLGVPVISKKFEVMLTDLSKKTNKEHFDISEAKEAISKISPYVDVLDEESAMYYEIAVNKVLIAEKNTKYV